MPKLISLDQIEQSGIDKARLSLTGGFLKKEGGGVSGNIEIPEGAQMVIYGDINTTGDITLNGSKGYISIGGNLNNNGLYISGDTASIYLNCDARMKESKILFLNRSQAISGKILRDENGDLTIDSSSTFEQGLQFEDAGGEEILKIDSDEIYSSGIRISGIEILDRFEFSGSDGVITIEETGDSENLIKYHKYSILGSGGEIKGNMSFLSAKLIGDSGRSVVEGEIGSTGLWITGGRTIYESGSGYYTGDNAPIMEVSGLTQNKTYRFEVSGVNPFESGIQHSGFGVYCGGTLITNLTGIDYYYKDFVYEGNLFVFEPIVENETGNMMGISGIKITEGIRGPSIYDDRVVNISETGDYIVGETTTSCEFTDKKFYYFTGEGDNYIALEERAILPRDDAYNTGTVLIKKEGGYELTGDNDIFLATNATGQNPNNWWIKAKKSGEYWGYIGILRHPYSIRWCSAIMFTGERTHRENCDQIFIIGKSGNIGITLYLAEYDKLDNSWDSYTGEYYVGDLSEETPFFESPVVLQQNGCVREISQFDGALTSTDVSEIFEQRSVSGAIDDERIDYLFKINEGQGNVITDVYSGYTGAISGGFWV